MGENLLVLLLFELYEFLYEYVVNVQDFYGDIVGVRIVCKYVGWYFVEYDMDCQFCKMFNVIDDVNE